MLIFFASNFVKRWPTFFTKPWLYFFLGMNWPLWVPSCSCCRCSLVSAPGPDPCRLPPGHFQLRFYSYLAGKGPLSGVFSSRALKISNDSDVLDVSMCEDVEHSQALLHEAVCAKTGLDLAGPDERLTWSEGISSSSLWPVIALHWIGLPWI